MKNRRQGHKLILAWDLSAKVAAKFSIRSHFCWHIPCCDASLWRFDHGRR